MKDPVDLCLQSFERPAPDDERVCVILKHRAPSTTLLGNPMPEGIATGDTLLNARLIEWLGRQDERGIQRDYVTFRGAEIVVCTLEDRGRFYRALSTKHWEDAVRNALGIGLEEDFGERLMGVRPACRVSFELTLPQWLRYRDDVTP